MVDNFLVDNFLVANFLVDYFLDYNFWVHNLAGAHSLLCETSNNNMIMRRSGLSSLDLLAGLQKGVIVRVPVYDDKLFPKLEKN